MDTFVTIISIIGALIVLGIIIMVHEFGHYSIGRACNIKIVEFAIGFGPKIKKWVKNDIIYSVRWFFIGGFTKFYGEDEESDSKLAFNNQPAGRRALSIAAGPVYNFVFAFLLVIFTLCIFGDAVPTVGELWKGSPAEAVLQPGDVITSMNGVHMDFAMELSDAQAAGNDFNLPITVIRNGQPLNFNIIKQYYVEYDGKPVGKNMAGISFNSKPVTYGFFEAIAFSFKWMYFVLKGTVLAIIGLFAGKGTQDLTGTVGTVVYVADAIKSNFQNVLRLGVAISVSLSLINLLPLPALDGGRLVFIAIEKIFKKPVPRNIEGMIHFIGFAALMLLLVLMTYQDIARLIRGGS